MKKPKFRKPSSGIKGKDWMRFKPYNKFGPYDQKYVRIASQVNEVLKEHRDFLDDVLESDPEEYSSLAITLTSYLEDLVNEIGIWKVFTDQNEELYGYPIPFMEEESMEEYEAGDLNYEDVKYLIWHFLNTHINSIFAPDSAFLMDLAADVTEVLDDSWDEAPVSDFYDEYLTFQDDIDLYKLKHKLTWFALHSYPVFKEAQEKFDEKMEKIYSQNSGNLNLDIISQYTYMIMDEQVYIQRFSYNAMTTFDWFAPLMRGSESARELCLGLKKHVSGSFEWVETNDTHMLVKYVGKEKTFSITVDSFGTIMTPEPGNILYMRIVPFRDDWFLSGMASVHKKDEKGFQNPTYPPFHVNSHEEQESFLKNIKRMEEDFKTFFGSLFYLTKDDEELVTKFTDYTQFQYNNRRTKENDLPEFDYEKSLTQHRQLMSDQQGTAIAFIPNQGVMLEDGISEWLEKLENLDQVSKEDNGDLLFHLSYEVYPENLTYILDHYTPNAPLKLDVKFTELDFWPFLPFFSRYCQPHNYHPRTPRMVAS
ncbi:MAG: DUF3843 family protein [Bacteroidia bacterium]